MNKIAYQRGVEAAMNGWERISPYTNVRAEADWYAGYDSVVDLLASLSYNTHTDTAHTGVKHAVQNARSS